jgi:hypothetical protein
VAEKVRVAVVIRVDPHSFGGSNVTVVSVFFDLEEARLEALRLNELNGAKGLRYEAQVSRLYPEGRGGTTRQADE